MGSIRPVIDVLPFVAAFSRYPAALEFARKCVEKNWGAVELASPIFAFQETDYYEATMGRELVKQFFVCKQLADASHLADWKQQANQWEWTYANMAEADEPRPLNIDPGYFTLAKLVLASTKDHAHRIYLRDGIYAEVTLSFHQRQWRPHGWTFPDYARADYGEFFLRCREYLHGQLQHNSGQEQTKPIEDDRL